MSVAKSFDDQYVAALKYRLDLELDSQRRRLVSELEVLRSAVSTAIEAAGTGTRVNAHLIANAAMLTETIARYNLARELVPFLTTDATRTKAAP